MDKTTQEKISFFVDGKEIFELDETKTNCVGREIVVKAGISGEYQLFMETEGDEPDKLISDSETVTLSGTKKHFYSVPPATFGKL